MQLSVVIVNYNVKHFLEQCLYSVTAALKQVDGEVIVVDNDSRDGSLEYLQPAFPGVRFIANKENVGFARACNQGLKLSTGDHVLFLNPDTIIPEDCLKKCLDFMASHPDAGAMGIKMLDGSGKFLPESKRSFPSPRTSLFKLFGLSRLFPRSRVFSKYHLGHLDKNKTNKVDVLAGAFMLVKKEVLDKTGGFDERFFMYGEDVDLSYRIQEAGYSNYYFADSSILHFKGESTRKGSLNYVRMFYKAMSVFVQKHYGGPRAGLFNFFIHFAIWFRATLSAIASFIRKIGLPLIDAALILLSFWIVKNGWNEYVRPDTNYENRLLWISFPVFTFVFLLTAYYAGLYDRWYRRTELVRSTTISIIVLLASYALLPEYLRFSRAIVLLGALLALVLIALLRWTLVRLNVLTSIKQKEELFNTVMVGTADEYASLVTLLRSVSLDNKIIGRVSIDGNDANSIGKLQDIRLLAEQLTFRELIYCQGKFSFSAIIEHIRQLPSGMGIKIHATGSGSIVGSESRDISGESVSNEMIYGLSDPYDRRIKRLIDLSFSLLMIISFPVQLFLVKRPFSFFMNCLAVLAGQKTWIGYAGNGVGLPKLRRSVITANGLGSTIKQHLSAESLAQMDQWYARDYDPADDLKLLWRSYRRSGG